MQPTQLIERVLGSTGYLDWVEQQDNLEHTSRAENLRELANAMAEATEQGQTLEDVLDQAALASDSDQYDDTIPVSPNGAAAPLELVTEPYPGFPTDMQAQMCALLSTNDGISVITENIFPQRYMHIAELKRMGAQMQLEGATAVIHGVDHLFGAPVMASDLRASAALVLAGLKAEGVTEVSRVYHIDRGYEHLDEKLSELGAHIERVKGT